MSDSQALDFFDRLERDLHAAAQRAPRRGARWTPAGHTVLAFAVALAAIGLALVPVLALLGGGEADEPNRSADERAVASAPPVGTVIGKGEGTPPRSARSTVVAIGRAPFSGPWQLEVSSSPALKDPETGEVDQRAGPCLFILTRRPPKPITPGYSGYCGPDDLGFRKTPGFSRAQTNVPPGGRAADGTPRRVREVLVYGRTPERATKVVVTAPGGVRIEVEPQEGPSRFQAGFYVVPIEPGLPGAKINWLDERGTPGSRGIRLMPPITP